jgi:23S rRNA (adenine2030-N6)-methyltransferase
MNYRHAYHAGNFADVLKHICIIALIESLTKKEKPFCYLDTHAGAGIYDLLSLETEKTKEYLTGIEKVIACDNPPAIVKTYLDCVHSINNRYSDAEYASLRYYPGSPMLARHFLRGQDRMVLCELHLEEYQTLKKTFGGDKQVAVHHSDGYLGLKAFLPPEEKRGLILIDPPYEDPDEFSRIAQTMPIALKRFAGGIFAIWYPIKEKAHLTRFHHALKENIAQDIFIAELSIYPDLPHHLNGCGMAVINPPWQFDTLMQATLPWLWKALTINNQGAFEAFLLK